MPVKGERIGPYQVLGPLGAGGMGEVYRARDTNLGRDVALKVLPLAVAGDPERLTRFEREARTLASLNHPNIAAIYGLEQAAAGPVLVMEFVEGRSLDEVVKTLRPDDALPVARQIAEALEAAHEQGIIHRDLKPANVMVRDDGTVKVLDFGLAKALDPGMATSARSTVTGPGARGTSTEHGAPSTEHEIPTMTSPAMTAQGVILGTASYMAPEQARGRPVDRRADIWSFGVVLYEMLTREQLFGGESMADVFAAVMTRGPDLNRLPPGTPPAVRALLGRCLERDPKQRLQSIGEARIVLSNPWSTVADPHVGVADRRARLTPAVRGGLAIGLVAVLGSGVWLGSWLRESSGDRGAGVVRKLDIAASRLEIDYGFAPVISPDGTRVVYRAGNALWVRDLASLDPLPLPESADARYPAWSPDSRFVVYARLGENIWKSPVDGGTRLVVGPTPTDFGGSAGIVWTGDGRIVLSGAPGAGLSVMPETGGTAEVLVPIDRAREADFHEISLLPDGRTVLFVPHTADGMETIETYDGSTRKAVLRIPGEEIRYPVYSAGYLVFERRRLNTGVWAVKFSLDGLETAGAPFLVAPEAGYPSASVDGTLAIVRQTEVARDLVWVDRRGAVTSIAPLPSAARSPRLSPDGRRAAVLMGPSGDIWTGDLSTGALSRITVDASAAGFAAQWTPDGSRLIFSGFMATSTSNLYSVRSDGTGGVTRLTSRETVQIPVDITSDGRTLVFVELADRQQLQRMPVDGSSAATPIFQTPFAETWASLSPDDRWLAYESNESGRSEIAVRPLEPGAARVPISTEGGAMPEWSPDGREIFYWQGTTLMAVPVTVRRTDVAVGRPEALFTRAPDSGLGSEYDASDDGQRFLFLRQRGDDRISLVFNWPVEAAALSGAAAGRTVGPSR